MSLRVVLLAEGGGELGAIGLRPAPGDRLRDEELGAAHVLVARCLERVRGIPPKPCCSRNRFGPSAAGWREAVISIPLVRFGG